MTAKGPERIARVLLVAMMLASAYRGYFAYRAAGMGAPGAWVDLLTGHGIAPEQYRVGVVWLSHWMVVGTGMSLPAALAAIDLVSGVVAGLVLLEVLRGTDVYRRADGMARWVGVGALLLSVQWSMGWMLWLPKPETMVAAMLVAVMVWLWQSSGRGWGTSLLLIALTLLLATVRADVALLLNVGFLVVALARGGLSLGRGAAVATSAVGAVAAAALQLWLMRVAYPQASYGPVKRWQLVPNLVHATRWPPFVLFMLPLGWMAVQVARRRFTSDAVGLAVMLSGALYLGLWVVMGKVDEVRVFVPFALALAPLLAERVMLRASDERTS